MEVWDCPPGPHRETPVAEETMRLPGGRLVLWSIPHGTVPAGPTDLPAVGEYRVRVILTGSGPQAEVLRKTYGFEDPRSSSGLESFLIQRCRIKGCPRRTRHIANRLIYVTWS